MTPEQEIIADLLGAAVSIRSAAMDALSLIDTMPADEAAFDAMTPMARVATTAMLKSFEQLEDTTNGLFRAILRTLGVRLKGLYPLDVANRMEELDVLDDPARWVAIVKLRNELVHEYPGEAALRFTRMIDAHASLPFLFDALTRAERLIRARHLLEEQSDD